MDQPMPKVHRPISPYAADAARLLGQFIRRARIDRKLKAADLTDRVGISRGLLRRIENGDPGCTIGAVFEVAAIVGVQLFDAGPAAITATLKANRDVMTLLPKAVRSPRLEAKDDF
jgi:transcriptional regulator with XRE-family HTH domain